MSLYRLVLDGCCLLVMAVTLFPAADQAFNSAFSGSLSWRMIGSFRGGRARVVTGAAGASPFVRLPR